MPAKFFDYPGAERQTLDQILDWYRSLVDALIDHHATVQRAIREGVPVASRFIGMTDRDLDVHYDSQRRELDRLTVLNLVASAEAHITEDFFRRVELKQKDPLARQYRNWFKTLTHKKKQQPSFDEEGILTQLKRAKVVDKDLVGRYRACLTPRHWVGHGRRWNKPPEMERLDPDEVYDRATALLLAMPN